MTEKISFQSIYQSYQPMVLQMCMGYMKGDRDKAMDLTQEVFINVWNALSQFRGKASPKTWIYRITVNTCLMQLRKEKSKNFVQFDAAQTEVPINEPDNQEPLYHAIGSLKELDRLTIMLVLEELEYPEIAHILGVTEATLRVKIHRIKRRLKKLLENEK